MGIVSRGATLVALGGAVFTACAIDAVQLDGRECPCASGWTCDSTNHCVMTDASVGGDAGDATPPSDGQTSDVSQPDGGGTLLFDEEFDGGALDPQKWTTTGDGTWTISGGMGEQTSPSAQNTLMYANKFTSATAYHIVTRMHSTGPFNVNQDLAPEICFRTDPSVLSSGNIPETYQCDFDLLYNVLQIFRADPNNEGAVASTNVSLPGSFNPGTWFVLDAVVQGTNVTCTLNVDGLGQIAAVTYTNLQRGAGSFGLKTYETKAEYAYFRVYSVP